MYRGSAADRDKAGIWLLLTSFVAVFPAVFPAVMDPAGRGWRSLR
jgi:hypothetical protein